jgi:hypothetical protein
MDTGFILYEKEMKILGAFANLRKTTMSFIMSVYSSIRPHAKSRLPLDGFS